MKNVAVLLCIVFFISACSFISFTEPGALKIIKLSEERFQLVLPKVHLEQEYFNLATGIDLEREVREAIINAHSENQFALKFKHFKRAIPYITYEKMFWVLRLTCFHSAGPSIVSLLVLLQ